MVRRSNVPHARDARSNERTRARLAFAVRRREALIKELAPDLACAGCGTAHNARDLIVDHVDGRTYDLSRMSPQMRAAAYWRDHTNGVALRALCVRCSCTDGARTCAIEVVAQMLGPDRFLDIVGAR